MNFAYFEDAGYERLLPLTWLRACFELRCGCDRLIDKARRHWGPRLGRVWVRESLREVIRERIPLDPVNAADDWCLLNARAFVTGDVQPPRPGVAWQQNGYLVAAGVPAKDVERLTPELFFNSDAQDRWLAGFRIEPPPEHVRLIAYPWELILGNAAELRRQCRSGGQHLGTVDAGVHLLQPGQIYIGRGARIKPGVVLDAEDGPVHIDEDVVIQPNAVLEGPCYVGHGSFIRAGASIRPGTTIGPVCKVGGEIESSVLFGYSNKQHEGFVGHSYVGSWVNLGAGTITSDLKNTYGAIRVSLNGQQALQFNDGTPTRKGCLGLGVEGGRADFLDVLVLPIN
jgi:UDP-N-acetylglucosamine diphosphorylase/glucosamine-1-phosphate N-acetyltransferase